MKAIILIVLVTLIAVRRIQRSIGFQLYRKQTLVARVALFGVLAAVLLYGAALYPTQLIPDVIGIIAGLALAYIATRHAQFEKRENRLYFKTHILVEIIVIALFLVRFAYRLYINRDTFNNAATTQNMQTRIDYFRDPFTGLIFLAFCFYYIGYYSFILKEGRNQLTE